MRRILICLLVTLMLMGCSEAAPETTQTPVANAPATALEALQTVWELHTPEQRFSVMGGDMDHAVDGAPGEYAMENRENLQYDVLLPLELLEYVDGAATMVHMMNRNNFTCVALSLKQGMTMKDYANALRDGIRNQQWMCGFPDSLFIAAPAENIIVMAFGVNDPMNTFVAYFDSTWPEAQVFTWEVLT